MFIRVSICLFFLSTQLQQSEALSYYYSYQDAVCVDESTIQGTFVMSWDDEIYADYGYTTDYEGACLYLKNGSASLFNDDGSTSSFEDVYDSMAYGSCVTCDGLVGCSSDGSCSNFKTYAAPMSSSTYQLSQGSNQAEQASPKFGSVAKQLGQSSASLVKSGGQSSNGGSSSESPFLSGKSILGSLAVVGIVGSAMATFFVGRKRKKLANQALTDAMVGIQMGGDNEQPYVMA